MPPTVQLGGEFDPSVLILRGCGRRGEAVDASKSKGWNLLSQNLREAVAIQGKFRVPSSGFGLEWLETQNFRELTALCAFVSLVVRLQQ